MREADAPDVTVREVAKRHDIAESLIYSWRTARRQAENIASEPLAFISYGTVPEGDLVTVAPALQAQPVPTMPVMEELTRPHPGARPGEIGIDLPSGVRLSVDSHEREGTGPCVADLARYFMISLAPGTKDYLASKPVSMRLGFDGLAALVRPLFAA